MSDARCLLLTTVLLVGTACGGSDASSETLGTQQDAQSMTDADAATAADARDAGNPDTGTDAQPVVDAAAGMDAAAMAIDMGFGANIGNTLENTTVWETGWGQPRITQQFIAGMASSGVKTVRVPVAWDTYAQGGVIPSDKMTRVREVVQWIVDAGLYSIVNIHWDGGWIRSDGTPDRFTLTDAVRGKFESYWQQIATEFSDVGPRLIFEAMNEEGEFYVNGDESGSRDYAPLNELNQLFVSTVRDTGGHNATRNLLISGFVTDIDRTCVSEFAIPNDPAGANKLFLSVHYYTPYPFTLMTEPANFWADVWTYPATTWGSAAEKAELDTLFGKLAAFSAARDVPVIIGEFTVTKGSGEYVREPASRILWLETVIETALSHGMVPVLWDTGGEISRADGSLSAELSTVVSDLGL